MWSIRLIAVFIERSPQHWRSTITRVIRQCERYLISVETQVAFVLVINWYQFQWYCPDGMLSRDIVWLCLFQVLYHYLSTYHHEIQPDKRKRKRKKENLDQTKRDKVPHRKRITRKWRKCQTERITLPLKILLREKILSQNAWHLEPLNLIIIVFYSPVSLMW